MSEDGIKKGKSNRADVCCLFPHRNPTLSLLSPLPSMVRLLDGSQNNNSPTAVLQAARYQAVPLPEPQTQAHHFLTKLSDQDDIEAYLHTFEVIAAQERNGKESSGLV